MTVETAESAPHVLREYALLGDGERGALIGPRGDVAWMCLPGWADGAVFDSLLGGAGVYSVTPTDRFVWGGYYEPRSLIWRSRWVTDSGIVECREALAFPGDPHRAVLLRQLRGIEGCSAVRVRLRPVAEFGRQRLDGVHRDSSGTWHGRLGDLSMRWRGAADAVVVDDGTCLVADVLVEPGRSHDLVLELSSTGLPLAPVDAARAWDDTRSQWDRAMPALGPMAAQRDAEHAYAVMRGMTTAGGGMVAATTTSLPERADAGANYDYRYVWIRDQCFAGLAVAADGPHPLLTDAVDFVADRILADGPDLVPAYTTAGRTVPAQYRAGIPGYPGGGDRIGNHVRKQFQLDVFGDSLLLFAAAEARDVLQPHHVEAARLTVDAIERRWRTADAGIWELDNRHWTQSRLECVAGLRAAAGSVLSGRAAGIHALADAILADVSRTAVEASGRWRRAADDDRLDAALLLPLLRGALPVDDRRARATYEAVREGLSTDFYVYRFPPEAAEGGADSAFLLCGFVMAMLAAQQGENITAARYFERNRSACGPPGLLSEEYDIRQRQMRGNLPQAFVHALLFEASSRLADVI